MSDLAISGLTEETAPHYDDLVVIVADPATTPLTKKCLVTNLMAPNLDESICITRGKIFGDSDVVYFSHYDNDAAATAALYQTAAGATSVNTKTGTTLSLSVAGTPVTTITATAFATHADADIVASIGRAKVVGASDVAYFQHYDGTTATDYAIKQSAAGATTVNAVTGQNIVLAVNNSAITTMSATALTFLADADAVVTLGRSKITGASDVVYLHHYDLTAATDYAVKQSAAGATGINAKTGQAITFAVNNTAKATLASDGTLIVGSATSLGGALQVVGSIGSQLEGRHVDTDSATKGFTLACTHYTNAEECTGIYMNSQAAVNAVLIGGGTNTLNAATTVGIYAAANNTTTTGTEIARITTAGLCVQPAGVAQAAATALDIYGLVNFRHGGLGLTIGADAAATTRTNTTEKFGRIVGAHYTNAEEPVGLIQYDSAAATTLVNIGGGDATVNAATTVNIYAGATSSTTTGSVIAAVTVAGMTIASTATTATLLVQQAGTSAAKPCLELQQDDDSEEFIEFDGAAGADATSCISTLTGGNAVQGFVQVTINGTSRWIPFYDNPTT